MPGGEDQPKGGKSSTWLMVGAIAGGIVLIAGLVLLGLWLFSDEDFEAGGCAKLDGESVIAVSCEEAEDDEAEGTYFEIDEEVGDDSECDPTQAAIEVDDGATYFCATEITEDGGDSDSDDDSDEDSEDDSGDDDEE